MKKKILILSVIILALTAIFAIKVSAYEITSAEITITPSKTEVNPGDTVDFIVSLKNLKADTGLIGVGAYLEYDSNLLELSNEAKGLSGWTDATISSISNRFVTTRNNHSSNNEDILKITFTVKDVNSDKGTTVGLSQIELSNGSELDISSVVSSTITIKPKSYVPNNPNTPDNPKNPDNPNKPDTPDNPNNPDTPDTPDNPNKGDNDDKGNNQQNGNTVKPDNNTTENRVDDSTNNNDSNTVEDTTNKNTIEGETTNKGNSTSNSNIPNLGANAFLTVLIGIALVVAIILFVRMKLLDKKINNNGSDNDNKNQ